MYSKRERTGRRDHPQRLALPLNDSTPVYGAFDGTAAPIQHVRVDHRRPHVAVAEQLLHSTYVVPIFDQVRGEAMAECVTGGGLRYPGPSHLLAYGPL
jgi:hypothetical protein